MGDRTIEIFRKLRGLVGLGLVGAALGFVAGPVCDVLVRVLLLGYPATSELGSFLLQAAIDWSLLGAFTGVGFGGLLAVTDGRRSLAELPQWRMALLGAVAGASFLTVYVAVQGGPGLMLGSSFFWAMGTCATLGACLTSSMVVLAKRAHRDQMPPHQDLRALDETHSAESSGPTLRGSTRDP